MLFAEPTAILFGSLEDRVPAAQWVRALAVPTVLSAGHPHADDDVGAVASVALAWTASVSLTEALDFDAVVKETLTQHRASLRRACKHPAL